MRLPGASQSSERAETVVANIGHVASDSLSSSRHHIVMAVFSRAVYLRPLHSTDQQGPMCVLTPLDVPSGPLHARVHELPRFHPGQEVLCDDGWLHSAHQRVELPRMQWVPPPVDRLLARRRQAAQLLRKVLPRREVRDLAGAVVDVAGTVTDRGLGAGLAVLAGRGAGLTPAGDDCSAGIMLVTALLHRDGMDTYSPQDLSDLVIGYDSNDIARAFIGAAAQGECIEPLHLLLSACADGDRRAAMRHSSVLASVGHTSGLDVAYGALVGLELADAIASDPGRCCAVSGDLRE